MKPPPPRITDRPIVVGLHTDIDPSAALVIDGSLIAFSEEERHNRIKHAPQHFPSQAIQNCLTLAGISAEEVTHVAIAWDFDAHASGEIRQFFHRMRETYPVDTNTIQWQERILERRNPRRFQEWLDYHWRRIFGTERAPEVWSNRHHWLHAFQAFRQSPFEEALCLTVDGSGDTECTMLWKCRGTNIEPVRRFLMPNSLGWFYAAFTEYLGFDAYDGEYKVMGLASYGRPNRSLRSLVQEVLSVEDRGGYTCSPSFIHYGKHSYSSRYTDALPALLDRPPRLAGEPISAWHEDLAYEVQHALEEATCGLVKWGIAQTGINRVCIGGGVGLNVKMNSAIFHLPEVGDVFAHPLCSDSGSSASAALAACEAISRARPEKLETLALGYEEKLPSVVSTLSRAKVEFRIIKDIEAVTARLLADGAIVGWFQGRMEAGPRALGHRSILADPRSLDARDQVNEVIKFREYWRPFCPSMPVEAADRYFEHSTSAPFMIIAFKANETMSLAAPAVVHIDGTSRVQLVDQRLDPSLHKLLREFEKITGVPILLNTSFNVKGEPIVCTAVDALRTFWSTGLDALVIENALILKPGTQSAAAEAAHLGQGVVP